VAGRFQRGAASQQLRPRPAGTVRIAASPRSPHDTNARVKFINPAEMFQTGGTENGDRSARRTRADVDTDIEI
jgi:hypothetical protein